MSPVRIGVDLVDGLASKYAPAQTSRAKRPGRRGGGLRAAGGPIILSGTTLVYLNSSAARKEPGPAPPSTASWAPEGLRPRGVTVYSARDLFGTLSWLIVVTRGRVGRAPQPRTRRSWLPTQVFSRSPSLAGGVRAGGPCTPPATGSRAHSPRSGTGRAAGTPPRPGLPPRPTRVPART